MPDHRHGVQPVIHQGGAVLRYDAHCVPHAANNHLPYADGRPPLGSGFFKPP